MRDVAIVSFAQAPLAQPQGQTETLMLLPTITEALGAVGMTRRDVEFTCSGSADYLTGGTFTFVQMLEAAGAWPPISESHVDRNMRVAVFFGEYDFKPCREESIEAVEWYRLFRFNVEAKYVTGLGHERTPQTAAAFFARNIGATPKTPPNLGTMVLRDIPPEELGKYSTLPRERRPLKGGSNSAVANAGGPRPPPSDSLVLEGSPNPPMRVPPSEPLRRDVPSMRTPPPVSETPRRRTMQPY